MAVPVSVLDPLSSQTVTMLDERFFSDSELDATKKQEVRGLFQGVCTDFGQDLRCEVLFRKGGDAIGANAFALPSGQIIVTDEFVAMAQSPQEIEGVLAHEMAHVQKRHSVRHALQHTGVFLLISALVGDIGSISSLATTLPAILVESGYSREFEEEADRVACLYLLSRGESTVPFQDILIRMTSDQPSGVSLFSSHPLTDKRVELMQGIEAGYHGK
jgi:Zn-dependent protease with chaperone function